MTVKAILDTKGSEVITIEPGAALQTVIGTLTELRIGASSSSVPKGG
jgi:hypothetical protein